MPSHASRDRFALSVTAVLVFGLVYAPHTAGRGMTTPRLTEVSAVRLQAEVTSLVTGMVGTVGEEPPAPAASGLTGTGVGLTLTGTVGPTGAASCTYPCTVIDKFLWNLPVDVRNALLPPLYAVTWVIGLVLAPVTLVTSAVFGRPYSLRPAAAVTAPVTPEIAPAPDEATVAASDPIRPPADPVVPSSAPGETAAAGQAAVAIASGGEDTGRRLRGHRSPATSQEPDSVSPEVSDSGVPATAVATDDAAPAEQQQPPARGRSAEAGLSDSASHRAKRSAR